MEEQSAEQNTDASKCYRHGPSVDSILVCLHSEMSFHSTCKDSNKIFNLGACLAL